MVLRGPNPRFSGKSIMCYVLKHKRECFGRKSWKSWNHVFKSLKYSYVYKWFLQLFKTAKIAEPLVFAVSISWNFMRFSRKCAQNWYVSNVYWYFSMMFSVFHENHPKTHINVVVFLFIFESDFPSSPRSKYQVKSKEYWWFRDAIFQEKHLNPQPGVRTGFKVLEPEADFWPQNRNMGQKASQNTTKT